jgi:putative ABC transport system permease protein
MKIVRNLLKAAFKSLAKNRMRSLLTSLGIIIGVSAVVVMVSIGKGSQKRIQNDINSLGTNLLMVRPGSVSSGGTRLGAGSSPGFTANDIEKLQKELTYVSALSPVVRTSAQVIGGSGNWMTSIYGVNSEYFTIRDWKIESGEFFTEKDVASKRKVAVLGKTVADELFQNMDPVGQRIRINNIPFTVIGVLKSKGEAAMGQDQDDIVIAPWTTVLYRLKGGQYIDMLNASAVSTDAMDAAKNELTQALRTLRGIKYGDEDNFSVRSQSEIMEMVTSTTETMTLLLAAIAAVSLLVGGIGIMNIMLVSVTERTREIGIRLSMGARASDIMIQFLTEAIVLSLSGGIIGILLSAGVVAILNKFTSLTAIMNPEIIVISVLFSGAVGIFFGFYPARRAAALNPIDALRYE